MSATVAGEEAQEAGREGVQRAKRWLEGTGRVNVYWTVYEHASMLGVPRPGGGKRSFDMSGVILGGDLDGHQLYAEVKRHSNPRNQAKAYGDYLANCYCKMLRDPDRPYQFMWITWHPFSQTKWTRLCEWDEVRDEVSRRQTEWLGSKILVDDDLCRLVADRLWLIVLSDKQEQLRMSDEMLAEVRKTATIRTKR
ncbi:MAG: hypothetical protein F4X11_16030 [Acidobacteria bacterium]|nr:hypothetical protein [Acidobacteriota bacterium]